MSSVIKRTSPYTYLESVNTPEYPSATWLQNPDLSGVSGVAQYYWKVVGDTVVEMNQTEKDAVDAARDAASDAILKKQIKVAKTGVAIATQRFQDGSVTELVVLQAQAALLRVEIALLREREEAEPKDE